MNDPNGREMRAQLYQVLGVDLARSVIDSFDYARHIGRGEGLRAGVLIGVILGALGTFVLYLVTR